MIWWFSSHPFLTWNLTGTWLEKENGLPGPLSGSMLLGGRIVVVFLLGFL